MRKTRRALRATAVVGEFRWAELLDALHHLDWLDARSLPVAARAVRDAAQDFLDFCDQRGALLPVPLASAHRNLAVFAPTTALPMLRLAWGVAARRPDCDFRRWAAFLDARARGRGVWLPFRHLLRDAPRLAARDVVTLFPTVDLPRFHVLLRHAADEDVARRLRRAIHHCPGVTPSELTAWCGEAWTRLGLPRLSRDGFDILPRAIRRAFLLDAPGMEGVRVAVLDEAFLGELIGNPAAHRDTPAAIHARQARRAAARIVAEPPEEQPALTLDTLIDREALPDPAAVVDLLTPDVVRELLGPGASARGWFVWGLCGELLALGPERTDVLARFLRVLADVVPERLPEAVPDSLSVPAFARLCAAWPGPAVRELREAWADRTERPAWLELLARLRKQRASVPELLRGLATSGSEDDLRDAFRAYPDAFAEHGPALFPLRRLLRFAFSNARVAGVVERHFPRETLTAELDWVRQRWMNAPSVAAALELAVCFSLRDARFLCQLARHARRPDRPEDRGRTFDRFYRTFERPKKNGGVRVITAPSPRLKQLQRRLLRNGVAHVPLHDTAKGFRAGESILTNAAPHSGKALVVNLDVHEFFTSTTYPLILRACRRVAACRLSARALFLLADLCSCAGALPTGAPTSPAVGNIVLSGVDAALATAAARLGGVYTRYADDLTFSGPDDVKRLIPFAKKVLGRLGYRVARRKINLFRRGRRQVVTGLVVNDRPGWPRHLRRLLRAAVDRRSRGENPTWDGVPLSDDRLRGLIAFLNLTRPAEAANLRARLPALFPPSPPLRGRGDGGEGVVVKPGAGSRNEKDGSPPSPS